VMGQDLRYNVSRQPTRRGKRKEEEKVHLFAAGKKSHRSLGAAVGGARMAEKTKAVWAVKMGIWKRMSVTKHRHISTPEGGSKKARE